MKEIEKKEAPEVSGGYRPDGSGGCITGGPLIVQLPGEGEPYPKAPNSPWVAPDHSVIEPPSA